MKKLIKTLIVTLLIIPCMAVMAACSGPAGTNGKDGTNGTNGTNGTDGTNGESAYQIWLDNGNTGSADDFLEWLRGKDGEDGRDGSAVEKGDPGEKGEQGEPGEQGETGEKGANGDSAYQIWLDNGNTGSQADFLKWLKGTDGTNGAKGDKGDDGEPGTNGAKGDKGDTGDTGAKGEDGKDGIDGTNGKSAFELWLETNHAADYAAENGTTVDELVLDNFFEWMTSNGGGSSGGLVAINIPTFTHGTITAAGVFPAPANTLVTLTVTPDAGCKLVDGSLKVNGTPVTLNGALYQFYMPTKTANITAEFMVIPMPPTAPQNITVVSSGNGFVEIVWTAPSSTGGYPITEYQVSTDSATWTTADGETYHKFTNLTNGDPYTFYVRANNFEQNGTAGSVAGAPHTTAPSAPMDFHITQMADNGTVSVHLVWDAPTDNGGGTDDYYSYYVGTSANFYQATQVSYGTEYYTFSGLTAETVYTFYVWARNANGTGEPAMITTLVRPMNPPSQVQNLKAETLTIDTIRITWDAPADNGGGEVLYTVYYYYHTENSTYNYSSFIELPNGTNEYTFTGLENHMYYFCVEAANTVGSNGSEEVWRNPHHTVPSAPQNFVITQMDDMSNNGHYNDNIFVSIKWDAPADTGDDNISTVRYYVGTSADFSQAAQTQNYGSSLGYYLPDLTPETTYTFYVWAVNDIGESEPATITKLVHAMEQPSEPQNVKAEVTAPGTVRLTWDAVTDNGGDEVSYSVRYSSESQYIYPIEVPNGTFEYTFTGLDSTEYRYTFSVSVENLMHSNAAYVDIFNIAYVPNKVQNLTADGGNEQITITWDAPVGGAAVEYYEICNNNGLMDWTRVNGNSYTITNLENGREYRFSVRALGGDGAGEDTYVNAMALPENKRTVYFPSLHGGEMGNQIANVGGLGDDRLTAFEIGGTVRFDLAMNTGFVLNGIYIKHNGQETELTPVPNQSGKPDMNTYEFEMPAYNVVIRLDYTELPSYSITAGEHEHGSFYTNTYEKYYAGEKVRVGSINNVNTYTGYKFTGKIWYKDKAGNTVILTADEYDNYYIESMPAYDVVVYAEIVELADNEKTATTAYADYTYFYVNGKQWHEADRVYTAGDTVTIYILLNDESFYQTIIDGTLGYMAVADGSPQADTFTPITVETETTANGKFFTFTMPAFDIAVVAEFNFVQKAYLPITITPPAQNGEKIYYTRIDNMDYYDGLFRYETNTVRVLWIINTAGYRVVNPKFNGTAMQSDDEGFYFIMPAEPVNITYEVEKMESYIVTKTDDRLGMSIAERDQSKGKENEYAYEGSRIYLWVDTAPSIYEYVDGTLTVTGTNGEPITPILDANYHPIYGEGVGSYYFLMPDCDVTISANFTEIETDKYWGTINFSAEEQIKYLIIDEEAETITMHMQSGWDNEAQMPIYSNMEIPFTKDGEKYIVVGGNDGPGTLYGGAFEKQGTRLIMTNIISHDNGTTWQEDGSGYIFEYSTANSRYENAIAQGSIGMYLTEDGKWYMVSGSEIVVEKSGEYTINGANVTFTFEAFAMEVENGVIGTTEFTFTGTLVGNILTVDFTAVEEILFGNDGMGSLVDTTVVFIMA